MVNAAPVALITGANRGLGLEFARQYVAAGWQVIATARAPSEAHDLRALGGAVSILPLDVADDASLESFIAAIGDRPLDLVIANAGIGSGSEKPAARVTREEWQATLSINTYAPFHLAAALCRNLERGGQRKLVAISSLAASIAAYPISGHYAYRASKAALNMLWRSLAVEWRDKGIICVTLRPGRVRTRMTGFNGDLTPEQSVTGMRAVIDRSSLTESGRFIGHDGQDVPW